MDNNKEIPEDVFSEDPYIKAIQEEIIAEINRRTADGRITGLLGPEEFQDVERTAIANVDRDYKKA